MGTEKTESQSHQTDTEGFGELLQYTLAGYGGGLLLGTLFDYLNLQRNPIGQWIIRTISGESESIFEGTYAFRQRLRQAPGSIAEAYGWGKFFGITAPWIIDFGSRSLGVDVYAVEGFYIPYFYALGDQIGASISGLIFLRRQEKSWSRAMTHYVRHPVMLTSLLIIFIVPIALLLARIFGFSPTTQISTAVETIAANLCWLPPLVGWLQERREKSPSPGNRT